MQFTLLCGLTYTEKIQTFGLLLSAATFFFAIIISRRIGKNHIKTKQIEHVCSLIEELNKPKIRIMFNKYGENGSYSGSGFGLTYNIFEIGSYSSIDPKGFDTAYEAEKILFEKSSNQIIDVARFIDHPLTPKLIADELMNFYTSSAHIIRPGSNDKDLENFVGIRTGIWTEYTVFDPSQQGNLIIGNAPAMLSWLSLKKHSSNLKLAIGRWMSDNGIDETNIREDFKYRG